MSLVTDQTCPICGSTQMSDIFEVQAVPVFTNILCATREAALDVPKGDILLRCCKECEFITNVAYDPALLDYDASYENALHFSPTFQKYSRDLADQLIERHLLDGKTIVEIGCGDGHFLKLLCKQGKNVGIGFDPSYDDSEVHRQNGNVKMIQDYYSSQYAHYKGDFYCCRHTLEHLQRPKTLLQTIKKSLERGTGASVFFEVPNVSYTLNELAVWDIIYEHCSYFSANSLARLFSGCGFQVQAVSEGYHGQFLCLEAIANETGEAESTSIGQARLDTKHFWARYKAKLQAWQAKMAQIESTGKKAVVWGAGSKGVTFLNSIRSQEIEFVVDINSRKQGKYVVGAGQLIVSPAFLADYRPDYAIVMNPVYLAEIKECLGNLEISCETISC